MDIPIAANVLGTLGAVCWSIQLIPQIIINYRRHNATGLQPSMMMFWAWAGVPLGVYNITSSFNLALQIQPQILAVLSLCTWIQVYYYEKRWSMIRSLGVVVPIAICMAGIEFGLVVALERGKDRGVMWPATLMAVLAATFLACGVGAHYWDIYTHRTVRGISFTFCFIDALGDLTSLISVFFQPRLDVLGIVIYGTELVLWLGIFACGGYYNLRPWIQRQRTSRTQSSNADEDEQDAVDGISLRRVTSSTSAFSTSSANVHHIGLRDRHPSAQVASHTASQA
ncbi:PQ loop repeat protein [Aureobasidium sp. EXF-10728]|nr:PQ loop repeat protein [Aureobasidium sp. EXF-10728]